MMVFCGQCGLQIAPGITRCPRCGTPVDTNIAVEEFFPNDATMASLPYAANTQNPQGPYTPGNPQKLVLHPDEYDEQGATSAATNRMGVPYYDQGMPYPGYGPQSGANYATQTPQYADATPSIHTIPGQYPNYQPYQQAPVTQRSKGRVASLIVILVGLLLILAAMALFTLFHFGYIGGGTNTPSGTVTTSGATNSPEQQAQAVVTQYYTDVNNKAYGPAYDLWQDGSKPAKTLNDMIQGYKNTLHDDLTVTDTALLHDGTVEVTVTLQAQEQTTSGGTQLSTYKGYYIVGQQNGTWKIQSGTLNKVTA